MLGLPSGRVKAALTYLVVGSLIAGCFWRSYGRQASIHADLLVAMARKGVDLVAAGRLTAESLPELTYPLERARAFATTARARAGEHPPASLDALDDLIEQYRSFIDTLDRTRRESRGEDARTRLANSLAAVESAATKVHTALASEGRAG